MFKKISNFLKDLLQRSARNADRPYIPQPPDQKLGGLPGGNKTFYKETNIETERVAGSFLDFGTTEEVNIDENGNATRIRQKQGHILGSGKLVTGLNPEVKDGIQLPGVRGACYRCMPEAAELLQAGLISIEEAQRRALFDTDSAAQCDICGRRDLCIRHCRPFDKADGTQLNLCPDCTKKAEREKWFQTALGILLSPFADQKQLPPARKGEDSNY